MINERKGYSYNDLTIIPSEISNVSSRSECDPYNDDKVLPIFASPMTSVVNIDNYDTFIQHKLIPIIPRNKDLDISTKVKYIISGKWVALSLKEFEDVFITNANKLYSGSEYKYSVVIDIANGHMKSLYRKCIKAKLLSIDYGYTLVIMTGNIANPKTYKYICTNVKYLNEETHEYLPAIDYIRVGIGGGSGCITTSNVSIHYPQASLIDECKKIKNQLEKEIERVNAYDTEKKYNCLPKIVADGGIRNYDHVIKALALGADYVMIGSLFSQCIESAGVKSNRELNQKIQLRFPIERYRDFEIDHNENWWAYYTDEFVDKMIQDWKADCDKAEKEHGLLDNKYLEAAGKYEEKLNDLKEKKYIGHIDVKFFGMASADGQKSINGEKTKTAEGITKYLPVKYTLAGWVDNMISYLRSAMSYTNCKNLKEFIGKPELIVNSISEIQAVNK